MAVVLPAANCNPAIVTSVMEIQLSSCVIGIDRSHRSFCWRRAKIGGKSIRKQDINPEPQL
jgi:hypothetical protein